MSWCNEINRLQRQLPHPQPMPEPTAIISLKVCRGCGAKAPLGQIIDHADDCSGDHLCDLEKGAWPLAPGDEIVVVQPKEIE